MTTTRIWSVRTSITARLGALLLGTCVLAGCGQKGPLYLPDAEQTTVEESSGPQPSAPEEVQRRDKNDPKAR